MAYVVDEKCIKCKTMECVEICPVDCFYEGENMIVINPDECIDCGVCEPECPVESIHPDTDEGMDKWKEINRINAEKWPMISKKGERPYDWEDWVDVKNKYENYFSDKPGQGGKK